MSTDERIFPAYPSRDLYAFAAHCESRVRVVSFDDGAHDRWKMPHEAWKRHLEAKARLYLRAGDTATGVADGGPPSPAYIPAAEGEP